MGIFGLVTTAEMNAAIAKAIKGEDVDISALQTDVTALQTSVASADDELSKLEALVKGLTPENFTQADIDALDTSIKAAKAALDQAVADNPVPPTP